MIIMLIHSKLGIDTIIEDYIISKNIKKPCLFAINFFTYISILVIVLAIIKIFLS